MPAELRDLLSPDRSMQGNLSEENEKDEHETIRDKSLDPGLIAKGGGSVAFAARIQGGSRYTALSLLGTNRIAHRSITAPSPYLFTPQRSMQ